MLLSMIFPDRCICCSRIIGKDVFVCNACWHQFYFSHHQFDGSNDFAKRCRIHFPVEYAFSLFEYKKLSAIQLAIHQLKYRHREKIGELFARLLTMQVKSFPKDIDFITYIPIHSKKKRQRGFNQLTKFCTQLGKHYNISVLDNILVRTRHRKAQARSSKIERHHTDNLFRCMGNYNNTHFLLIDDVFTTGNTIASAAWELLKSGNGNKISILVIAEDN